MSGGNEWKYERYRLGELSEIEKRELESHPDFAVRMAELDQSDAEILKLYPPTAMAEAIALRAETNGAAGTENDNPRPGTRIADFRRPHVLVPMAAAAAILAALIIVFPIGRPVSVNDDAVETLRPKGLDIPDSLSTPEIILYRNSPEGVEILRDGDEVREHDLLQVGFMSGGNWWGSILSVDGNGVVTRHWPMDGNEAVSLGHTDEFLLPFSYELDDAPGFEAFFLIWSDAEYHIADAESLLSSYHGDSDHPGMESLNPGGKTGLTVIQVHKAP